MTGHVEHTALGIVLVTTLEIILRVDCHITRRHGDILIVRDVHTCRVIHLVIGTRSDGETRHSTLSMVKHRVDIGWEDALVGIVDLHGRVCPPEEGLRQ